jgi:hypothetical protein
MMALSCGDVFEPLITHSFSCRDELLGAVHLGLPAPVVPLLPQLVAVLLDPSERQLEARQLGFSGRQFGR